MSSASFCLTPRYSIDQASHSQYGPCLCTWPVPAIILWINSLPLILDVTVKLCGNVFERISGIKYYAESRLIRVGVQSFCTTQAILGAVPVYNDTYIQNTWRYETPSAALNSQRALYPVLARTSEGVFLHGKGGSSCVLSISTLSPWWLQHALASRLGTFTPNFAHLP